jgi:hypothetical protein
VVLSGVEAAVLVAPLDMALLIPCAAGTQVVWWGVSSCTVDKVLYDVCFVRYAECGFGKDVAEAFVGLNGPRVLFQIKGADSLVLCLCRAHLQHTAESAVSVEHCSAIPDEAEWIIAPGVTLGVSKVSLFFAVVKRTFLFARRV